MTPSAPVTLPGVLVTEDDPTEDWTREGVFHTAPGVYRIPLPLPNDGLRAVNVYAIEDPDGLVLVDAGMDVPESRQRLAAALAALDAGFGDVRRFLVTHVHRDHYAQAVTLRREFGSRVSLGAGEQPSVRELQQSRDPLCPQRALLRRHGAIELAEQIEAGLPKAVDPDYDPPDEWVTGEAGLLAGQRRLRAVETPGHTRGHVVFRDEPAGLTFAGDHVLPHITPSIGFEPAPVDLPLRDYLGSLRLVRGLDDTRLLPAHGPVARSVHERVDELLDHHGHRLDSLLAAVGDGQATARQVAGLLGWTRRNRRLDELDPFNQMLAVLETAAHLDLLVVQQRATVATVDDTFHYAAAS